MDPDTVSEYALNLGNDRAADDGSYQQTRSFAGQRSQTLQAKGKDARKHDRIKQANRKDTPHGQMPGS